MMADLLIRDVPEDVVAAIDAHAERLRLTRSEYLRRRLKQEAVSGPVKESDLKRFAETFADLADADVMARAWE